MRLRLPLPHPLFFSLPASADALAFFAALNSWAALWPWLRVSTPVVLLQAFMIIERLNARP